MIPIPRPLAREFRAVARKCRPPGRAAPAPTVLARVAGNALTLSCDLGEVAVAVTAPAPAGAADGAVAIPMAVLDAADGPGAGTLDLARSGGRVCARWLDRGSARELTVDAPARAPEPPAPPAEWADAPTCLLAALHECGRTAASDAGRFALHRVQVQGTRGAVAGTDGAQALVWSGLSFPFADDILVPAVPVFGAKEFAGGPVRVGRTDTHLAVSAGAWTVWLRVDSAGRFPDVLTAAPRPLATVTLTDADAALAAAALAAAGDAPVVIAASGRGVRLRAPAGEVALPGARLTGPPAGAAVAAGHLRRALGLGLRTLHFAGPDRPVCARDATRAYLVMPAPAAAPAGVSVPPASELAAPPAASDAQNADVLDPLAEAEGVRAALADAAHRAGRLVAALKRQRRERRVLTRVAAGLKALDLAGRADP